MKDYKVVRSRPVARFYYTGSHSHPVMRTVLVIESTRHYIRGYELREGKIVRSATNKAPVKTYRKSRIARVGQCGRRLRRRVPENLHSCTTYERQPLINLVKVGF